MDKKQVVEALKYVKEISKKRNFKQAVDLIINFSDLDLKKPDNQIDLYLQLHNNRNKKIKVCAFVDVELEEQAKKICDNTIHVSNFDRYAKDKKLTKKLAKEYDFFIAQANIMPKVALAFGKVLGPRNKMPNPKAGCVVPPNTNLKPLYEKLQKTIRITVKTYPFYQCVVGYEDMNEEDIVDNIIMIYNNIIHNLPKEHHNIKSIYIKLTMGKAVKIGKKIEEKSKNTNKK
jgi:large subunit ribosomal protein L1